MSSARAAPEAAAPTWSHRLAAAVFSAAASILSLLPRRISMGVARACGRALFHVLRSRQRIALANLGAALGSETSESQRRRMARESFGHAAAMAVDLLTLSRVARDPDGHCEVPAGSVDVLRQAASRGRGVILVAGHFGLFESMGIALGHAGFPVTFVAKPFDNPLLDRAINALRGATGNRFVHKGGAKGKLREVLAGGGLVAIVLDQHVGPHDRAWIPFFGLPAATARSVGVLAAESGAPIVPIHGYPAPGGGVRCDFGPLVEAPPPSGDGPAADAERLVAEVVRHVEEATRRMPEAWLWVHRRWKVCPDALQDRYPAYSVPESDEHRHRVQHGASRG